ncbi:DUF1552 domain-containing protein [Luteolibacter algae]|uniref:DUF1552 domain-containing protein n=1 Tax=Luteolibacter algae TaxID=454151 RepID=A0ABW5D6K4_9BACT
MKSFAQHTRRAFLRGSSALVALPFLESLGFRKYASAATTNIAAAPKRMVFLGMGYGVTENRWYPDINEVGRNYTLPKMLKPLERHRDDMTIIQNLENQFSNDGHSGSTFWLTGANRYAISGQSFHNTISADQVAAEQLGKNTRFTSIQLASKSGAGGGSSDGHGPGLSLAWNRYGKPIAAQNTPVAAYHRLFSDSTMPLEQRQKLLAEQHSVLDAVLSDATSLKRKINPTDADKLNEYFQSIREIEVRLEKEKQWLGIPVKEPERGLKTPGESLEGVEEIRMMYDLMVAAMQVDATRVLSYRMPVNALISSLGAEMSAHTMSHYTAGERYIVSEMRDLANSRLLAEFFDKLKALKDADGSSLFDNTVITFGSNLRTGHSLKNCPTLVAGGGAGIVHGRHLVMEDKKTPLCNLWLSLLNGVGVEAESHGDSTGIIKELFEA